MDKKEKWMMNWCRQNGLNPASDNVWKIAEKEYNKIMEKNNE